MSGITRWSPFEDLRLMRSMFDRDWPYERNAELPSVENLPLDIYEKDGELTVKAALPGVKQEDVHITISDDVLRIRAEKKEEKEVKKDNYYLKEYTSGTWTRSVRLPPTLQTDKATARFDKGELFLTIPKRDEARPKSIKIDVK